MNVITLRPIAAAALALAGLVDTAPAADITYGPTPYLSFNDSPFAGGSFSYFYLETFEDHLLNTPGVSANTGGVTSVVFGPDIHDSVDADDGVIDGSGLKGDSYFSGNGAAGVTFSFDAGTLGQLPTSAGLVWTDGGGGTTVTFSAFGPNGTLIYTTTKGGFADYSNNGETAEDRFFGIASAGSISAIFMSNASGGIEVDHLQYGLDSIAPVPEPQTYAMMLAGLAALSFIGRRRQI